jgi:hypothetical protein
MSLVVKYKKLSICLSDAQSLYLCSQNIQDILSVRGGGGGGSIVDNSSGEKAEKAHFVLGKCTNVYVCTVAE